MADNYNPMFDTFHQYNIDSIPKTGKNSRVPVNPIHITEACTTIKPKHQHRSAG
jgi:hypothetical protein